MVDRRKTSSVKWDMILKLHGEDVLPLWIADMDFESCPALVEALKKRAEHGIFGYTFKDEDYYKTIMDWYLKRYGVKIKREWIVDGPGVIPMLALLLNALTEPGDKVMIQPPVYPPFFRLIASNGRIIVENRLKKDGMYYTMDFEDLESKIDEKTKMLILCNPHNPVGRVWKKEELERLVEIVRKHNLVLVSDEIHGDIVYTGHKFVSILNFGYDKAIVLNSAGKTFNVPGLTNSYGIIKDEHLRNIYNVWLARFELTNVNIFGMEALKVAYSECERWVDELLQILEKNRNFAVDFIKKQMPLLDCTTPEGTFLLWIDCGKTKLENPQKFFLEKARVYLNDGSAFGDPLCVRLNFATSFEILSEALKRMKKAYDEQMEFLVLRSDSKEFEKCLKIREEVFVKEQGIDKSLEVDGKDQEALHYLLKHFSIPVATARSRKIEEDTYKIERVAVLKEYRKLGYGKTIMNKIEEYLMQKGAKKFVLNSQLWIAGFYERLGYEKVGEIFEEAGIPHVRMQKMV
ncbi:PatB family C-S lyase [Pseudothermotoga thermarum]|uniref:cysteine-S-conjugate beta-lyase n=1 Tax=Pseudothermotoga thermarum DSM 5069 TaxID=688269 RepID=F7YTX9_9THEM|nr:PatB family C-S lyase [Pseudothermotoga thermarum]AEH51561.1 aminotransferase class I and II [Pseudothermotoga thermarum DSM 5069]